MPNENPTQTIDDFHGEYLFLSNFYPCRIHWQGQVWATNEHAYQAAKTEDLADQAWIRGASTPNQAKKRGRAVEMRSDWDDIKDAVMLELLFLKFESPRMRDLLLSTGDAELIEGNWWGDTYWGVCRGEGKNRLGELLMTVREHYRAAAS